MVGISGQTVQIKLERVDNQYKILIEITQYTLQGLFVLILLKEYSWRLHWVLILPQYVLCTGNYDTLQVLSLLNRI